MKTRTLILCALLVTLGVVSVDAQRGPTQFQSGRITSLKGQAYVKTATYGFASVGDSTAIHRQRFIFSGTTDVDSSVTFLMSDLFHLGVANSNAAGMMTIQYRARTKLAATPNYTVKLVFSNDGVNWTGGTAGTARSATTWFFDRFEIAPYVYGKVVFSAGGTNPVSPDTSFGEAWVGSMRIK